MVNKIHVSEGEIRHSTQTKFRAPGFFYCSAIVLDYGKGVFFGHALTSPCSADEVQTTIDTFIPDFKAEFRKQRIPFRNLTAYVNAGRNLYLEVISEECEKHGIAIAYSSIDKSPEMQSKGLKYFEPIPNARKRIVSFDPSTKLMKVRYHKKSA